MSDGNFSLSTTLSCTGTSLIKILNNDGDDVPPLLSPLRIGMAVSVKYPVIVATTVVMKALS